MKILSIFGIIASLFLAYVGYGIQELKAYPYSIADSCLCKISGDSEIIPLLLYIMALFFLIFSGLAARVSFKK